MLVKDLVNALEEIAPTRFAESWDNVGLLVGDAQQAVSRAMLTIDYTAAVADEAKASGVDAVIAYHPPIFSPIKRLTAGSSSGLIFDAVRRGVAIYSPHTAIDVAPGGTNDMLADALGLDDDDRGPLRLVEPKASQYKLVTFVPKDALSAVSEALYAAGAGHIGNYSHCSFQIDGTGTFLGEEGTNPVVGQSGRLERSEEVRFETVLPIARLNDALTALRATHPYEEPAFDLVQLATPPEKTGQGRVGSLRRPAPRQAIIDRVKAALGLSHLLIAGPTTGAASRVACCAGSCGDLLNDAIEQRADVYLTGEMKHHDALRAAAMGMTVLCTLHSNSERAVLRRLADKLRAALPGLAVTISERDRDPFTIA